MKVAKKMRLLRTTPESCFLLQTTLHRIAMSKELKKVLWKNLKKMFLD
jgi:hypothetical protein